MGVSSGISRHSRRWLRDTLEPLAAQGFYTAREADHLDFEEQFRTGSARQVPWERS